MEGVTKEAEITAVLTWPDSAPYTLKWKDTVTVKPSGDIVLERGEVSVTQ